MVDYIPDNISKFIIAFFLALVPLLIVSLVASPIFDAPNVDVTILEKKEDNLSKITMVIQNTGNEPSTNLVLTFDTKHPYRLIDYQTNEFEPKIVPDNNLKLQITRLAAQSYLILNTEGDLSSDNKRIWITADKFSKVVLLPYEEGNVGISSVYFRKDINIIYGEILLFGFCTLFGFRYLNFLQSETKRRDYLGIYDIKLVRYKSSYLGYGAFVLIIGFSIGGYLDLYEDPFLIDDYTQYTTFELDEIISPFDFVIVNDENTFDVTGGHIISIISIFVALWISNKDITIPKFIWSLKASPNKVILRDISSSYLTTEKISINSHKEPNDIKAEIIVLVENDNVVGLLPTGVAIKQDIGKKHSYRTVFSDSNYKKKIKIPRMNFMVVKNDLILFKLKEMMEKEKKRYAIVENNLGDIMGVLNYDDTFGKPSIFAS